jgi:uncharacterized lipoprotein YmbA
MLHRLTPVLAFAISAMTGCTHASVHLYTLAPYSKNVAADWTERTFLDPFVIEGISIPPSVDRKSLVLRTSTRELVLLENESWASPLRDEVRRALAMRLQRMDSANPIDVRCDMRLKERTSGTPDDIVRADQALLDAIANAIVRGMDSGRCSEA